MKLISINALKEWIENWFVKAVYWLPYNKSNNISILDLYNILEKMPTVDAEPVRHGHWIRDDNGTYSCSECQSWVPNEQHYYARYCLFCGAKMDGGENEANVEC